MRVLVIVSAFPVLSETFILNQITGLLDRGHDVHIYALRRGDLSHVHPAVERYNLLDRTSFRDHLSPHPIARACRGAILLRRLLWHAPRMAARALNVRRFGRHAASLELLFSAAGLLDAEPFDIIHCHFGTTGVLGRMLRDIGIIQGAFVTSFYGYDLTKQIAAHGPRLYHDLFERGDAFLSLSETFADVYRSIGGDDEKLRIHHLGVDVDRFACQRRQRREDDEIRLLTVSRLVEKKGVEYAIRAVKRLIERGVRIRYRIVGDGPLRHTIETLIADLGIAESIELLGWQTQDKVQSLLQETEVFLAPSITASDGDQEGTPVSVMEAMAAGLPVVSTRHSGIPEIIEDGESGLLVPERDVDGLCACIAHLADSPKRCEQLGRAARTVIEQKFNIGTLNDRLPIIYRDIAQSANGCPEAVECQSPRPS